MLNRIRRVVTPWQGAKKEMLWKIRKPTSQNTILIAFDVEVHPKNVFLLIFA